MRADAGRAPHLAGLETCKFRPVFLLALDIFCPCRFEQVRGRLIYTREPAIVSIVSTTRVGMLHKATEKPDANAREKNKMLRPPAPASLLV